MLPDIPSSLLRWGLSFTDRTCAWFSCPLFSLFRLYRWNLFYLATRCWISTRLFPKHFFFLTVHSLPGPSYHTYSFSGHIKLSACSHILFSVVVCFLFNISSTSEGNLRLILSQRELIIILPHNWHITVYPVAYTWNPRIIFYPLFTYSPTPQSNHHHF